MRDNSLTDNALLKILNPIIKSVCEKDLSVLEMESIQAIIAHQVMTNDYFYGMNQFLKLYYGTQSAQQEFTRSGVFLGHYDLDLVHGLVNQKMSEHTDILGSYSQRSCSDFGIKGAILSESERERLETIKKVIEQSEGINDVVEYFSNNEEDYYFIFSLKKRKQNTFHFPDDGLNSQSLEKTHYRKDPDKQYDFQLLDNIEKSLDLKDGLFEYTQKVLTSQEKEAFFDSFKNSKAYKKSIFSDIHNNERGKFRFDYLLFYGGNEMPRGWKKSMMLKSENIDSLLCDDNSSAFFLESDEFRNILFPNIPNNAVNYDTSKERREMIEKLENNEYLYKNSLYRFLKEYDKDERPAKVFNYFHFEDFRQQIVTEIDFILERIPSLEQFSAPYQSYLDNIWNQLTNIYPELKGETPEIVYETIETASLKDKVDNEDEFEATPIIDVLQNKEAMETHGENYTLELSYGLKGIKIPDVDMVIRQEFDYVFFTACDNFGLIAHNTTVEKTPSHMSYEGQKEATWLYSQQADYLDGFESKTEVLKNLDQRVMDWAKEKCLMLKVDFQPEELNEREHDIIEMIMNDENVVGYFSGSVNTENKKMEKFLNALHGCVHEYSKEASSERNLTAEQIYNVAIDAQPQLKDIYHNLKDEPELDLKEISEFRKKIQKDIINIFKETEGATLESNNKNTPRKTKFNFK